MFTSPRSLLAILRLSTALARLRLENVVEKAGIEARAIHGNKSQSARQQALKK